MFSLSLIIILMIAGGLAGFIAGLLGLGGGLLMVPLISYLLQTQGMISEHTQHIAVGTSFAVMVFTSFSSGLAQHRLKQVAWREVKYLAPAMVSGAVLGGLVAGLISQTALRIVFVLFVYAMLLKSLWQRQAAMPTPKAQPQTQPAPSARIITLVGGGIGLLSSWIGIGGGGMTVPFLRHVGLDIRQAVGSSAVLGWPIALTGAVTYLITGLKVSVPTGCIGFIYWPGLIVLSLCTMICAPLGASVSNKLPPRLLARLFSLLLLVIALKMTYQLFY